MKSGIYSIENTVNEKLYIGSAVNFSNRWTEHKKTLRGNYHRNSKLQRAWNKYGSKAFEFKPLLFCYEEYLIWFEQALIDGHKYAIGWDNMYNISPTAGSSYGTKHSEESKAKQSISAKKKFERMSLQERSEIGKRTAATRKAQGTNKQSPETIQKIVATRRKNDNYSSSAAFCKTRSGRKVSEETKDKQRRAKLGKKQTPEHIANVLAGRRRVIEERGYWISEDGKKRIGKAASEYEYTPEQNAANSARQRGRKNSPESTQKRLDTSRRNGTLGNNQFIKRSSGGNP